jgi:hypothetical protein
MQAMTMRMIPLIALGVLTTASLQAQVSDAIAFAHFRMRMVAAQASPFLPPLPSLDPSAYPGGTENYAQVWSSFNEGTLDRDTHIVRASEQVTLKATLTELTRHGDAPGMESPIIYFRVLYFGDRYAYVQTDWMTNVPRGEDLYFERRAYR